MDAGHSRPAIIDLAKVDVVRFTESCRQQTVLASFRSTFSDTQKPVQPSCKATRQSMQSSIY